MKVKLISFILICFLLAGCNQKIADSTTYQVVWNPKTEQWESHVVARYHFGQTNIAYWFAIDTGSVVVDPQGVNLTAKGLTEYPDPNSVKAISEGIIAGLDGRLP